MEKTITKQMRFMNEYNRNLDSDLDRLAANAAKGKFTLDDEVDIRGMAKAKLSARSNAFSYDSLVQKPDMVVTKISGKFSSNKADIIAQAKKNAALVGRANKDGSVTVKVNDIDEEVILGTPGLKHSMDRRFNVNAPIVLKAGEILQNSIQVNELTAQKKEAEYGYVLIGTARDADGNFYIVRSIVNKYSNELDSFDVLYAINAKEENRLRSMRPGFQGPTGSSIKIADLLELVNEYFPDVLPESVLRHFGHTERPEGKVGESALFSLRNTEGVSNRSLPANALESAAQNDIERKKLTEYKGKIEAMLNAEKRRSRAS